MQRLLPLAGQKRSSAFDQLAAVRHCLAYVGIAPSHRGKSSRLAYFPLRPFEEVGDLGALCVSRRVDQEVGLRSNRERIILEDRT